VLSRNMTISLISGSLYWAAYCAPPPPVIRFFVFGRVLRSAASPQPFPFFRLPNLACFNLVRCTVLSHPAVFVVGHVDCCALQRTG
jgi:hypothetical protein